MRAVLPRGPFTLDSARDYFGGWEQDGRGRLVAAFPVEGWEGAASVALSQSDDGMVHAEVNASPELAERAWLQVLAALSLDVDGTAFPAVMDRDPRLGPIARRLGYLRPVCDFSPYEAAVARVLGQRSSIAQQRRTRREMARLHGGVYPAGDVEVHAFPGPQALLAIPSFRAVSDEKMARLHAIAQATLDGVIDRDRLRSLPLAGAVSSLREIRGVGDWTAQGIVLRGCGIVDEVPDDATTRHAVQTVYGLGSPPGQDEVLRIAEAWRPFRMWAVVLLHVAHRRGGPPHPAP